MDRLKLFIENFLVYGLGGMISKIIPFIMLPLITRLMPNSFYFGLSDISTIVISFAQSLAVMGMYDAMFRMFFERNDTKFKKDICSTTLTFTLFSSFIIFMLMIFFQKPLANLFFNDEKYANLLCLCAVSVLIGSTNSIISAPTRMQNKRKVFLFMNTISPIISYSISIPLLLRGYYVIALPLASAISAFSSEFIFLILNRKWFSFRINKKQLKVMLKIALPLLPNFLVYWIFNSSDRLMISKLIGTEWSGIYAVGSRIGQVSQLIYTAFAGGWQYFAFSTMKDDDQVDMTSKIFEYLGIITFSVSMLVTSISYPLFIFLFSEEYLSGYIVMPYLFAAPLTLMLFQILTNQFLVVKKTWPNIIILSMGALINVILNYILIPIIGIEGASFATLIGYTISILLALLVLTNMNLINIPKRFIISTILFVIFFVIWRFLIQDNVLLSLFFASLFIACFVVLYRRDILSLIYKIK